MDIGGKITISDEALAEFCRRWDVVEVAVFGSVLRDDFTPESDVDLLVTFGPEAEPTLFDIVKMQRELESIIGRRVDVGTKRAVEQDANELRRSSILDAARVVYAR
jgi:hypothetical protein